MPTEVTHVSDPSNSARTIYTITGPSFEAVQGAAERLMEPGGSVTSHFSIPFLDRKHQHWIAYGAVQRLAA